MKVDGQMKVLVYGAGVIGCFLAHTLCEAGQEVSILARGKRREELESSGLVIRHSLQKKTTVDHPRIIGAPGEGEKFDMVFATVQYQQISGIIADLAAIDTPLVTLVGNNMSASDNEKLFRRLSKNEKKLLFGFQATAGGRVDGIAQCVRFGSGSLSLGGLREGAPNDIKEIISNAFSRTKYELKWVDGMDAWYKSHLALILPVSYLCYALGCDLRQATLLQCRQALEAAGEACGLLKTLGYPILPEGSESAYRMGLKRGVASLGMFAATKTSIGELAASEHCKNAVVEMRALDEAFACLRKGAPNYPMPAFDALRAFMPNWEDICRVYARA
ncbi:MAG: ketopantoate reductase family protein [Clostridiales bacterium]|jgi:2-dehydropantoate 2-reductase|nr:ketopantoate reductase family protein [Clostridiales bacterium]